MRFIYKLKKYLLKFFFCFLFDQDDDNIKKIRKKI